MSITESVAQTFLKKLSEQESFGAWYLTYELQDDWNFILVSVDISGDEKSTREEIVSFLEEAQETAESALPWRSGEYSWMINVKRDGKVVESVFGGDLQSPRSGRIA